MCELLKFITNASKDFVVSDFTSKEVMQPTSLVEVLSIKPDKMC